MILFIAGNALQPFTRLAKFAEAIASISEYEVLFQNGAVSYTALENVKLLGTLDRDSFEEAVRSSEFVVTHCGAGTLRTLNLFEKPSIGIPRLKRYGEHIDDHQLQIAEKFSALGRMLLPHSYSKAELPTEEILSEFRAKSFQFGSLAEKALNREISRLLRDYIR